MAKYSTPSPKRFIIGMGNYYATVFFWLFSFLCLSLIFKIIRVKISRYLFESLFGLFRKRTAVTLNISMVNLAIR
jgi:hypothetical protein